MRKRNKIWLPYILAFALAFALAACAEQITGVSLNYDELSLEAGEIRTLGVAFTPQSNTLDKEVEWSVVANPKNCVTVDGDGNVTGVRAGVAVVTAKVTTKFGAFYASCGVTVAGGAQNGGSFDFNEPPSAEVVAILNLLAPSGQENGAAHTGNYFAGWSKTQIDAWNAEQSGIAGDYETVLAAYKAVKGDSAGAVIVKTATTGYWSYDEETEEDVYIIIYTAIDKNGKILGMHIEDLAIEDYYSDDGFARMNAAIFGTTFVGKAIGDLDVEDFIEDFADAGYFTVKEGMFEAGATRPYYTSYAFVQSILLATEVFMG